MYEELGAAYLGQIVAKQVVQEAFYGQPKAKKVSLLRRIKLMWRR